MGDSPLPRYPLPSEEPDTGSGIDWRPLLLRLAVRGLFAGVLLLPCWLVAGYAAAIIFWVP